VTLVSTAAKAAASSGALTQLFTSTLGANTASIDTGAGGIAAGFSVLEAWMVLRTTEAAVNSSARITVNNDSGANYDRQTISGSGVTAAAGNALAAAFWQVQVAGATATAGEVGIVVLTIPFYAATTFRKQGSVLNMENDDAAAANQQANALAVQWRNTAAITRLAVTAGSGVLLAGSSLVIYGRT